MKFLPILIVFFSCVINSAKAVLIPSYTMGQLAHEPDRGDIIVLCEEIELLEREEKPTPWVGKSTVVSCKVIRSFKGNLQIGDELCVIYHSSFSRLTKLSDPYIKEHNPVNFSKRPDYVPLCRALIFLHDTRKPELSWARDSEYPNAFHVFTSKLIYRETVFEFGQFNGNPGALSLREQKPERIKLKNGQKYGEAELIRDLELSINTPDTPLYTDKDASLKALPSQVPQ